MDMLTFRQLDLRFLRDQLQNSRSKTFRFALSNPRHFEQFREIPGALAAQGIDRGIVQNHIRRHSLQLG